MVNYVSMTGRGEGGFIELQKGANYDYTKLNFLDRGSINDSTYYNVGGFYDVGHGPRHASYNISDSYQFKGNVTKEFDSGKGFVRLLFKVANTNEPNDTGGLICGNITGNTGVWGGASASNITTCPGFNIKSQSNYSMFNRNATYVSGNGNLVSEPLNGISTHQAAFQAQLHYKFDNGVTFDDNARYAAMSGHFVSNFFSISPTSGLIGSSVNGQTVAQAVYAAGPNAGKSVTEPYYNNNVEVATNIRDLGSFANDLKFNYRGSLNNGVRVNFTAGWFFMNQKIAMDWHPNQFNSEASGADPSPIDLISSSGALLSANG